VEVRQSHSVQVDKQQNLTSRRSAFTSNSRLSVRSSGSAKYIDGKKNACNRGYKAEKGPALQRIAPQRVAGVVDKGNLALAILEKLRL
jgi:hypothetical protein